jgi:membrane-associated phospholipid phosphatase
MKQKTFQLIGVLGVLACLMVFARSPSFLTPDKLLVFLIFVFMIFRQSVEMLKRFLPFVGILLVYESFRGLADGLNDRVEYRWMADVDRMLFGGTLPTTTLQGWWWHGQAMWYDFLFYLPYMLHFVLPIALAVFVWKRRTSAYWRLIISYVTVSFAGFLVFLAFPAAPPWMASELGYIEPIHRVSSDVWWALGIKDFPSFYNQISPNPVAAVPSLHAAYSTLFALYMCMFFKSKWRFLAWIYPALIYLGTVYQGEHYAIDEILGALLAVAVFYASPFIALRCRVLLSQIKKLCHIHKRRKHRARV